MKNKTLLSLLALTLVSCNTNPVHVLPSKGSVNQTGLDIYPVSDVGFVGDPMPFFDNGKMNIFYLQDGRNTNQGYHPINLMQTENYYEYDEKGTVIPFTNSIFEPDYSLGTGTVIKDKEGLYHFYYTGHNSSKSSGLEYYEKIQHATSTDLINWTKHPEDGFYGGHNDFRDPYVLYMEEDNCYWMLVTTRHLNSGVLKLYKSTDLKHWNYDSVFYDNGNETYNMECPTLIKYGNYWYLTFSEQGGHRVMHYRYTDSLSKPWIVPEVDYLDDIGFYAGRLEKDDQGKMYAFGWCATKVGELDQGDFDWGGNLVTHEIVQKTNGELGTKLIDSIKNKISNEVGYELLSNKQQVEKIELSSVGFNSKAVEVLSDNITRIEFTLRRTADTGECGISFGSAFDNTIGPVAYEFNIGSKYLNYYNNIYGISDFQYPQLSMQMENAFMYNVQIIIDDEIVCVYVDDTLSLTTRIYDLRSGNISFFVNNSNVVFENISFYE